MNNLKEIQAFKLQTPPIIEALIDIQVSNENLLNPLQVKECFLQELSKEYLPPKDIITVNLELKDGETTKANKGLEGFVFHSKEKNYIGDLLINL